MEFLDRIRSELDLVNEPPYKKTRFDASPSLPDDNYMSKTDVQFTSTYTYSSRKYKEKASAQEEKYNDASEEGMLMFVKVDESEMARQSPVRPRYLFFDLLQLNTFLVHMYDTARKYCRNNNVKSMCPAFMNNFVRKEYPVHEDDDMFKYIMRHRVVRRAATNRIPSKLLSAFANQDLAKSLQSNIMFNDFSKIHNEILDYLDPVTFMQRWKYMGVFAKPTIHSNPPRTTSSGELTQSLKTLQKNPIDFSISTFGMAKVRNVFPDVSVVGRKLAIYVCQDDEFSPLQIRIHDIALLPPLDLSKGGTRVKIANLGTVVVDNAMPNANTQNVSFLAKRLQCQNSFVYTDNDLVSSADITYADARKMTPIQPICTVWLLP